MTRAARVCLTAVALALVAYPQDPQDPQDLVQHSIRAIAEGIRFAVGPAWSKDGYLVFSDTAGDRILKLAPGRRPEVLREGAQGPSGNAFDSQGRLYTCETRGRRVVRFDRGKTEVIAERWEGKRLNAPNGIAVAKSGHVYFTDPAFGSQADKRELDFNGVYHVSPKGVIALAGKYSGRPNGIALSPDGHKLYVSISDTHEVRVFDVAGNGDTSGERALITGVDGVPAGVCVDSAGRIHVAANGIAIYSPEGKRLGVIATEGRVTDCAFGERGDEALYMTVPHGVYRIGIGEKETQ